MPPLISNAILWRKRAAEARTLADKLSDSETKRTMLYIADAYDKLAQQEESLVATLKSRRAPTKRARTRSPRA